MISNPDRDQKFQFNRFFELIKALGCIFNMRKPLKLIVQLHYPPTPSTKPVVYHKWISFALGSVLAVSESLPFMDNPYNGVFHALKSIRKEWDNLK